MKPFYTQIAKWKKTHDTFATLQAVYIMLAVVLLLVAGLAALINASLGQAIAFYAAIAGLTFVGNGVLWAIIYTFVLPSLEKSLKPAPRKK